MDGEPRKRSLLQKFDIPIEFLDFSYVKTCKDEKILEKIVKVLRSGEEGFYPDLTKCAEEKLKELKPESKLFRTEVPAMRKECLDEEKRRQFDDEMKSWIDDMKKQDKLVKDIKPLSKPEPPIRKTSKLGGTPAASSTAVDRIKSTDYAKWDKFDVEAAELKIDLDEERQRELVEVKNKKNFEKTKLIEEIGDAEVDCLSDFEKDHLSLQFKEKGNECFRAKEYDEAIKEYTQSLRVRKSAAAFNNRALVCKGSSPNKSNFDNLSKENFFCRSEAQKLHQSNLRRQRVPSNGARQHQSSDKERPSFCRRENAFGSFRHVREGFGYRCDESDCAE